MSFDSVIGHSRIIEYLQGIVKTRAFSGAYLFSGPEGVGKTLVAKEFASSVSSTYDIEIIEPEGASKTISIKAARDIAIKSERSPYEGACKVFIIKDADCMTEEAANSLLKTLEEPQNDTIFILTTSHITRLPLTVISRCHIVKFSTLLTEDVAKILIERQNIDPDYAGILARISGNSPAKAFGLLEGDYIRKRQQVLERWTQDAKGANLDDSKLFKDREGLLETVGILQSLFRDAIFAKYCRGWQELAIHRDCAEFISSIASKSAPAAILSVIASLNRLEYYLERNGNPKLALSLLDINMDEFKGA